MVYIGTMAEVDNTTQCPVCFEVYEEEGEHIPRILQCFHTLCEKCIVDLLQKDATLVCPECRRKHDAPNKEKSFPQNKYIIAHIRRIAELGKKFETCLKHGTEINIFCCTCQKPICALCMIKDHKNHEFRDLQEINYEKSEELLSNLSAVEKDIWLKVESLMITKEELCKKTEVSIAAINRRKEEHMKLYEDLIKSVSEQRREVQAVIEKGIRSLDENVVELKNIRRNMDSNRYYSLTAGFGAVNGIAEMVSQDPLTQDCKFLEYIESTAENLCGKLEPKEFNPEELKPTDGEATHRFKLKYVSRLKLDEDQYSSEFSVRNMPWKLLARREENKDKLECLGFYLWKCADFKSASWSTKVKAELRLLNCNPETEPYKKKCEHIFCINDNGWGFGDFKCWDELMDPTNGFYNAEDDTITLECHVVAEEPQVV